MKKLLVLCLVAGLTALGNFPNLKAAEDAPAPAEKSEKKGPRHVPFHGKVETLDKGAGTMKVGERIFHVTPDTKITKAGKPATFEEAVIGEEVGGAFKMADSGRLELTSLRIGPKVPTEPKPAEKKP